MFPPRLTPLLAALLLSLVGGPGCFLSASEDTAARGGGTLGELVLSNVQSLEVPPQVFPGEALTVVVRGQHADGCTTFERFETFFGPELIELTAWSFRPVGGCDSPGTSFEARTTLQELQPGVYRVRVNDRLEASVAVLGPGGAPPLCQDSPPVTLEAVELPRPTHPGGSAELTVRGSLPSWCDQLLPATQQQSGDVIQVRITAEGCALSSYDPTACPEGPQPFLLRIPLDLPAAGSWRVMVNDQSQGSVEVVPTPSCRFSSLELVSLEAPTRVEEATAFHVALEGTLPSECAAVDAVTVDASTSTILLDPVVRECAATCPPLQTPAAVRAEGIVEGLPVGQWTLQVQGDLRSWPLEVVAAGTCAPVSLPSGSVEQVLVTTDLSYLDARAGQPLDLSVYGTLPPGCWEPPTLTGQLTGSTLALQTESANCGADCNADAAGFVASLAFPEGLAAGTYQVTVDGAGFSTFTVQ